MEKLTYDALADLADALYEQSLADRSEINSRLRPVAALHTRPPLKTLAADPVLRAAWIGPDAPARIAADIACAPFLAEDLACRVRLEQDLTKVFAESGWTEAEFMNELDRRVGLSLRDHGIIS